VMSSLLAEEDSTFRPPAQPQVQTHPATRVVSGQFLGKSTTLVFSEFRDRTFLAVTQLNKLGTVCHVSQDCVKGEGGEQKCAVFNCDILLGQASESVSLLGRVLAERLAREKPLLLTVAIKELELSQVKGLADFVSGTLKK